MNLNYTKKLDNKPLTIKESSKLLKVLGNIFKHFIVAIVLIISLFPIIWVVLSSFKTNAEIMDSALKLPTHFYFDGYKLAIKLSPIIQCFKNSVIVSVISTIINVIFVGMAAYVTARYNFKYKTLITLMFSSILLVPGIALSYPIFKIVRMSGLYNTKTALIIVYAAMGMPTTFYVLKSYFASIPREVEEAAYIDGSSFPRTFFRIVVPIAKPGLFSAAILQFLFAWNEFFFALLLTTGKESRTLPLTLSYFTSMFSANYSALFAAITIIIVPTIIAYVIMQEQIVDSLASGAVKG
jgi:raffinose/stachyose/melibiose transport system permease protein